MIARRLRMNTASKSNIIRLVSYLTDSQQNGQRVENIRMSNCDSESASWAAMELLATQKQNTRAKGDKTYHLVLSFHERLSPEQLRKIEDEVCDKLGFTGHQRVSVLHGDTENPHLHIAINKIHPETLTMFEPYYDHTKLANASLEIEQRYGLRPDNHVFQAKARETAAKNMEVAGDLESLIGWVQRTCLEDMEKAESWDELHDVLSEHGLTMRPRGNGLVIASGSLHIKASSVDRSLSLKRLENRFGEFTPGLSPTQPAQYVKRPMPLERNVDPLWEQFQVWRKKQDTERNTQLADIQRRREAELSTNSVDLQRAVTKHMVKGQVFKRVLYAMQRKELQHQRKVILAKYSRERREAFRQTPNLTWRTWLESEAKSGNEEALTAIRARRVRSEDRARMNDIRIWADIDSTPSFDVAGRGKKHRAETAWMKDTQIGADVVTPQPAEAPVKVTRKGVLLYSDGCRDDGHALSCSPHSASTGAAIKSVLMQASARYNDQVLHMDAPQDQIQRIVQVAASLPVTFDSSDMERRIRRTRGVLFAAQYSLPEAPNDDLPISLVNSLVNGAKHHDSQDNIAPGQIDTQRTRHKR